MKRKSRSYSVANTPLEADTLFKSPYYSPSYDFPYNPDPLCASNSYAIYDEMRRDDQVKVAIGLKKDMVVNTGWRVVCDDTEIAETLSKTLQGTGSYDGMEPSFDDTLRDMLSAYDFGFSISDPVFMEPGKTQSGLYEIRSIKVRPPHSFLFHLEPDGTVSKIEQRTDHGSKDIEPDKIIHHVYQADFGNPYGTSDLQAAHIPWKSKKFIMRMALRYSERFAGATVIGQYEPNMDPDEIAKFHAVLKTIQDNTTLVVPKDTTVAFAQTSRDSTDHYLKMLDALNLWIARAILVPDLLGVSGTKTGGGSYSLGTEQFKVLLTSIEKDRKSLARKITNHLVRPLAKVNFGDKAEASFEFQPYSREDQSEFLRLWSETVRGKLWKPSEDEIRYFLKKTGFPEPEHIDVLEAPQTAPFPSSPAQRASVSSDDEEAQKRENKHFSFKPRDRFEAKMDFADMKDTMDAAENGLLRDAQIILRRQVSDLIQQMKDKGIVRKFKPERIKELKVKYQRELNDLLRSHFREMYWDAVEDAQREIFPKGAPKSFAADDLLPEDYESIIKAESFKLTGDIVKDVLKRTENRIFSGVKSGLGENAIATAIRDEIEERVSDHLLRTITRTKTTEFFNAARKSYFDTDPLASQLVVGYQWSAILDDRTSEVCLYLDGKKFSKDDSDGIARMGPPAHFNCRSVLVPITKFEIESENDWDNMPSVASLQEKGGNLIFQMQEPNLIASGETAQLGDFIVVAAPGPGKRIKIMMAGASNLSQTESVIVGFRDGAMSDVKYRQQLPAVSGAMLQDFRPDGWLLSDNTDFSINLGGPVRCGYSVDYQVLNLAGERVQ